MQRVHNLMEAKVLIKEAYARGEELALHKEKWFKHDQSFLCTSFIRDTEFELVVEDTEALEGYRSVTCEVF